MNNLIEFCLSVQDEQISREEIQSVLIALSIELENLSAEVISLPTTNLVQQNAILEKGDPNSSILGVKINFDSLKLFGKWLYERLTGTTVKVTFDFKSDSEIRKYDFSGDKGSFQLFLDAVSRFEIKHHE